MEDILDFGQIDDKSKGIIKVIGVGGGGGNAVRNMYTSRNRLPGLTTS